MTQTEIIEMARQAGFERVIKVTPHTGIKTVEAYASDSLERFAKLIAAKEREVCAKIADEWAVGWPHPSKVIAEEIRARGQA